MKSALAAFTYFGLIYAGCFRLGARNGAQRRLGRDERPHHAPWTADETLVGDRAAFRIHVQSPLYPTDSLANELPNGLALRELGESLQSLPIRDDRVELKLAAPGVRANRDSELRSIRSETRPC